ncbi:MAG: lytic transglycosylase domain-containing protein [Christensenellaceae bacterium]|nr:lytic transglycosylase domain-containing protein [Christensenellaceae bacterium]
MKTGKNDFKAKLPLILGGGGLALLFLALALFWAFVWAPQRQKIVFPLRFEEEIRAAAGEFSVHPCLLAGLIYCESSFRPEIESAAGALGLTQIMPKTGEWLAEKIEIRDYEPSMLLDPAVNVRMGAWYLGYLLGRYGGRPREALTAYIAGQGQVDAWLEDKNLSKDGLSLDEIPGKDVKEYAEKVLRAYAQYLEIYGDVLDPEHAFDGLLL